jgi:DNA-binding response OmpR family regulator
VTCDEATWIPVELQSDPDISIEIDTGDDELAEGDVPVYDTFEVSLPCGETSVTDATTEKNNRKRILVIDDDEDLAQLIVRVLRPDYELDVAHRGLGGLALIKRDPPDLLILDAMLPEVHGFDIAQKIKRSDRYRHIPIIMMSSVYRGWRIAKDLKDNYDVEVFLEKPIKIDTLRHEVKRVLARAGGRRRMVTDAFTALNEGLKLVEGQDIDGAIEAFKRGIRADPLSAKLHYHLGVLYLKKPGLTYQAMQELEQAVELEPDFFIGLKMLATLYQQRGFKNKAVDMWERALRCSPDEEKSQQMREHLLTLL